MSNLIPTATTYVPTAAASDNINDILIAVLKEEHKKNNVEIKKNQEEEKIGEKKDTSTISISLFQKPIASNNNKKKEPVPEYSKEVSSSRNNYDSVNDKEKKMDESGEEIK